MNKSIFSTVEENEIHKPSPRKVIGDTVTQVSQYMLGGKGPLILCDLGQARIGREHRGNAMPIPYRAPEVILNMPRGNSVDAWSTGLLVWPNIPSPARTLSNGLRSLYLGLGSSQRREPLQCV